MRTLIKNNEGYKVFLSIVVVGDLYHVQFETEFEQAKKPEEARKKFEMFLTKTELINLENALIGIFCTENVF